jgi:AMP phosphorylase
MDHQKLTQEEIFQIVQDIVRENLTEVELSAFVTTSYIYGLTADEIEWLTRAMIDTGEKIEFDTHPIMDKHSIGGVPGNKISLLVVPIVAANGLLIPKTSSRAITGAAGTADLMEVLAPVEFSTDEIKSITEKVGGIIAWGGATNIAPADDKLIRAEYPLSIDPRCQMLASIMAKKGAVGADCVVIDIPIGSGTKVPTIEEGKKLARDLIELGERLGMRVECAMTYGASPVGRTVGPAAEVKEAIKVLETMEGPNSLIEKSTALAGILLEMGGAAARGQGKEMAMETLRSGKAFTKLKEIIEAQGGNPNITHTDIKAGENRADLPSPADGYVIEFDNKRIVEIARIAGAPIDKGAGVWIHRKKGETVNKGDPLITIFADKSWKLTNALKSAEKDYPIIVEGMLLERVQTFRVL